LAFNTTRLAHSKKLIHGGWALDGRPTPGSQKFEFERSRRDTGIKNPPAPAGAGLRFVLVG